MIWKYIRKNLIREWPFLLVFAMFLSMIAFFATSTFYDESRIMEHYGSIYEMNSHDRDIFESIAPYNISQQSYLFPFLIMTPIYLIFATLYARVSCKSDRTYIFLLKLKGENRIVMKNNMIHIGFLLLSTGISLGIYQLIMTIFNAIADMEIPLFVFSPWALVTNGALLLYASLVYLLTSLSVFSRRNMISFLREEY